MTMQNTGTPPEARGLTLRFVGSGRLAGPCALCGKVVRLADATTELLTAGGERLGIVCLECIQAGDCGAAARARDHAERLRRWAAAVETVAGELAKNRGLIPADFFDRMAGELAGRGEAPGEQ